MIDSPDKEKDDAKLYKLAERAAASKKSIPLAKFIACLGIPGSGKGTGSTLATEFGTIDKIRAATVADFEKSQDIGSKTAIVLHDWFSKNGKLIDGLLKHVEIEKPKTGIFTGKTFCFSGSFNPDKEYWIKKVEDEGAKVTTAPSKKTSHFVWGPGSGNKKEAAEQLKKDGHPIQILEIEDLEKLLGLDKDDDRAF
jgi:DNA ligase (NAD+)